MIPNYLNSTEKKKPPFFKILIITLLLINAIILAVVEIRHFKIAHENSTLQSQINDTKVETEKLLTENSQLDSAIKEKEQQYKDAAKNLKVAYLTFDDGPSKNTDAILAILNKYGIKATFFVIANDNYRSKYSDILAAGHKIALHSYTHEYKDIYISVDTFKEDINKLRSYITNVTGTTPENILRYPGGSTNTISHRYGGSNIMHSIIEAMKADNYVYYDWNVDSQDATGITVPKNKIVESVLTEANNKKKAVVLLHDTNAKTTTVEALPEVIEGLSAQGFTFDVLSTDTSLK